MKRKKTTAPVQKKTPVNRLKFEALVQSSGSGSDWDNSFYIGRAKVLGGWLVYQSWDKSFKTSTQTAPGFTGGGLGIGTGIAFVPDLHHEWDPEIYLSAPFKSTTRKRKKA